MTAFTICTSCTRTVMVSDPDEPDVEKNHPIVVYCPGCGHPNIVMWRRATPYAVTLAGESH